MAVKRKKGMRVNTLIIVLSGLVLLIAGILVYLLIIKGVYGKFTMSEILPSKETVEELVANKKGKIAILYSQYTQNRLDAQSESVGGSTWLSDNIDTWESFLNAMKLGYTIISDEDLENGVANGYKILVLPGSSSLSDRELIQIKKYLEKGGSVFATSGTASYSNEAKWRGWDFFKEVYGLKFIKEMEKEEVKTRIHTIRGNLPVTGGVPTGYTLDVATWDRPIYAEIVEPRTTQISFWFDFRREVGLVREQIQKSAGMAYGNYGAGRFVWFGFELNSVVGSQEDYIYFDKLFQNCIHWLAYEPTAYVKDWPAPYEAAAIFVPTLTNEISNANNLLGYLKKYNYPATFFVDPYVAAQNPRLMRNLSKYGDIGAILDIGFLESAQDTINKLYDADIQRSTIELGVDTLSKISDNRVDGIMPLFGFYDENTFQAMSSSGIDYIITDSLTDRTVPKKVIRGNSQMMVITKTARDDKKIIREYGLTEPKFQLYTYEEDIDRLLFEGGLYVLKVHTDLQLRPENIGVINDVMKYLKEKNVWVTSISELQKWWMRKGGIEMRYETRSSRRLAVEVSNPKNSDAENFVVQIHLNKPVKNIEISSDIINTKIPDFQFDEKNYILYLFIEDLREGQSRSLLVDFDNYNE